MHELSKQTKLRLWLLIVGVATLVIGTAYAMVQQSTRLAANDLPLATAQAVHDQLNSAVKPLSTIPKIETDLSRKDTTVFAIVTDASQHIQANSARLNGQPAPLPPPGVFSYAEAHGSDSFTWQPAAGIRLATEVLHYGEGSDGGFIIAGQSLKPAEDRINTYIVLAIVGWIGVVVWTTLLIHWPSRKSSKTKQ